MSGKIPNDILNYKGNCEFGMLDVDVVDGLPREFGIKDRKNAPWIRNLKLTTDGWTDCKVYYSRMTPFFNDVKVAKKGEVLLPHIYVWAEESFVMVKDQKVETQNVKMAVLSSADMANLMETVTADEMSVEIHPEEHDAEDAVSLTMFVLKFDERDPGKADELCKKAIDEMKQVLNKVQSAVRTEKE